MGIEVDNDTIAIFLLRDSSRLKSGAQTTGGTGLPAFLLALYCQNEVFYESF
jgi:hypothetical protein